MSDAVMEDDEVSILLVDDDDVDALAVERALRAQKAFNPLLRAHDGVEALEILRARHVQRPYLILLDINMPRMNGIELLKILREDDELADSVVFVLTTSNSKDDMARAYAQHIAGYIHKREINNGYLDLARMLASYWRVVLLSRRKMNQPAAMNLLLIDDDEVDRNAIIRALKVSGQPMQITEASNAAEGLQHFETNSYDAVLLDYRLPDQDGLEVLRRLRGYQAHSTAIVMLSGVDDEILATRCLEAGAQDFLLKQELHARHLMRSVLHAKQRHEIESQLRDSYDRLRSLAEEDQLTGLPNRYFFEASLEAAIPRAQRYNSSLALILLDLDNFKLINDSYGHDAGDELLQEVAQRLKHAVRDGDIVCRLGGDEFAILAQQFDEEGLSIQSLSQRILTSLSAPITLGKACIHTSASIGIATFPECSTQRDDLLKCADLAMYRSKRDGRNQVHFYSRELHEHMLRRVVLEQELRHALDHDEFEIHYQPQISAATQQITGLEALIRWQHPRQGLLLPADFLDIAEETGLIVPMSEWVLQTACRQLAQWHRELGHSELRLAVNLSPHQLRTFDLIDRVKTALEDSGIPPVCLELEITEGMLVADNNCAAVLFKEITALGVRVSVDDFGTGYSSPMYLKQFPISTLKIDRSFLRNVPDLEKDCRLLKALIVMARSLDLHVVAEGMEQEGQAKLCLEYGVDTLQGYYYGRPMPLADIEPLLGIGA